MAAGHKPHPEPLGRTVIIWLIPVLIVVLGIVFFVCCIESEEQTVISGGVVFLAFFALTVSGVLICYKYRNFFIRIYKLKKLRRRDLIILSAITFGTIPLCLFLLLNRSCAGKNEYKSVVEIIEKQLVRREYWGRFYDRSRADYYYNRVATTYIFEGEEFCRDLIPSPATDTAQFIEITYRHGLFGYDVVTRLLLK